MKTLYFSACKNGKELEKEFSTLERANADLWENNYYLGCVVKEQVSDEYYGTVVTHEEGEDFDAEEWADETTLDKYQTYMKGLAA